MKNTIIGFLFASLFFLIIAADIQAPRLRFGTAMISDSSGQPYITTNKGLVVNGALVAVDTLQTTGVFQTEGIEITGTGGYINFGGYNSSITENVDKLDFASDEYSFATTSGAQALLTLDSADGTGNYLKGYSTSGRGMMRTKVVQSTCGGTTPGNYLNIAHGISSLTKVISFDAVVYDDSGAVVLQPGTNATTGQSPGLVFFLDATNAKWFMPAAAGNLKNAGDTVRWTIRYME